MRMKTRGFLLFGFAFASVLSSSEVLTSPRSMSSKLVQPLSTDLPLTVLKELQTQAVGHDLKKRAIEIYQQSVYPKMVDNKDTENAFDADKKRESRFRFAGVRGKKDYESEYVESYPAAGLEKADSPGEKKTEEDLYEGKRGSLAFHGMRGKKLEELLDGQKLKSEPSDLNSLSTIQRYLLNNGLLDDANANELDYYEDVMTRQDKEEWDNNVLSKKSPYSFQGLKGRKSSLYDFKRALGFMGVRGKKDAEMWTRYFGYKRVPQRGFYGMKGKKAQSGFFGMRGKKNEEGLHEPSSYLYQDSGLFDKMKEDEYLRNRFRREIWQGSSKKKNSFYGVRGKKSTDERLQRQLYYSKE